MTAEEELVHLKQELAAELAKAVRLEGELARERAENVGQRHDLDRREFTAVAATPSIPGMSVAWSSDGTRLASSGSGQGQGGSGEVVVWDVHRGERLQTFADSPGRVLAVQAGKEGSLFSDVPLEQISFLFCNTAVVKERQALLYHSSFFSNAAL